MGTPSTRQLPYNPPDSSRDDVGMMMITNNSTTVAVALGLMLIAAIGVSAQRSNPDEKTITGTITQVNPETRIATITPADGPPVVVLFGYNQGGACDICLGMGHRPEDPDRVGLFRERVAVGTTWTLTYTNSYPEGKATWFPGGTVHMVSRAVAVKK